jgi:hypothetical protein
MAHFAEIDENNIVTRVLVIDNEYENDGHTFLSETCNLGGRWIKTSYNTYGGVHLNGGDPLRKNYAGVGDTYNESLDAFIPPKPFESWTLDESTCLWNPPIEYPEDGKIYRWDEGLLIWVEFNE